MLCGYASLNLNAFHTTSLVDHNDQRELVMASALAPAPPRQERKQRFPVLVKTLTGKDFTIETYGSTTIDSLKRKIHEEGIFPHEQRLIFDGQQLEDARIQPHYSIQREPTPDRLVVIWLPTRDCSRKHSCGMSFSRCNWV
jgi:ubiquitin-large subunit ribosomal protein L40e